MKVRTVGKRVKLSREDHRDEKYRSLSNETIRARHRMYGPQDRPTLFDMTSQEFTSVKGAGGHT